MKIKNTTVFITGLIMSLIVLGTSKSVSAEILGFDILGSIYHPSDSRYQGIGSGIEINIKLNDSVTMGYRTEELNVRAEDTVSGASVSDNHTVTMQGIVSHYDIGTVGSFNGNVGLWLGKATTSDFNAVGTTAMSSPLREPFLRITYEGPLCLLYAVLGVGYRFIPDFNLNTPFSGTSSRLNNFDGFDLTFGLGLGF